MPRYSIINPASFTGMQAVSVPDQEVMLSDRMKVFVDLWKQYDPPMAAAYDVETLEFDPAKIVMEAVTVSDLNIYTRINHAARAVTLAFAVGTDLDAIASRYPGGVPRVSSEIYSEGDSLMTRMAKDARYRHRIWLSPSTLAAAGTRESYEFFALTALPEARDVSATVERTPAEVVAVITLLMDRPDPKPTREDILKVFAEIDREDRLPLTDALSVRGPINIDHTYDIDVWLWPWADRAAVMGDEAAQTGGTLRESLSKKLEELLYLGSDHARDDIGSACRVLGVHHVNLLTMNTDLIQASPRQFINARLGQLRYRGITE